MNGTAYSRHAHTGNEKGIALMTPASADYSVQIRPYTADPHAQYSAIDELVFTNPESVTIRRDGKQAAELQVQGNGETQTFVFTARAAEKLQPPELFVTWDDFSDIPGSSPALFTPEAGYDHGPNQCPAYDEITWHNPYTVHVENLDYGQYIMLVDGPGHSYTDAVYAVLLPSEGISAINPSQGELTKKYSPGEPEMPPECWISLEQAAM